MKKNILLISILCIAFVLSNYINIFGNNWFKHPDETGFYLLGKELYYNHSLIKPVSFNQTFKVESFTPAGLFYNGNGAVPGMAYGIYFLIAIGFIGGLSGPFFIPPLFAILNIVIVYLIIKKIFNRRNALLVSLIWGTSPPLIYWSNSLFGNIAGATLYLIGLYFIMLSTEEFNDNVYPIFSGVFLALGIFTRYEYIIFVPPLLIVYAYLSKNNIRKLLQNLGLLISPIIVGIFLIANLNTHFYGSPMTFSYTAKSTASSETIISNSNNVIGNISQGVSKIINRFFLQDLNPDINRLGNNFKSHISKVFFPYIFSILGFIILIKNLTRMRLFLVGLILPSIFWTYDTFGGYHWGEGFTSISGVYVRYIPLTYILLVSLYVYYIYKIKISREIRLILIIVTALANILFLFNKIDGLNVLLSDKKIAFTLNKIIDENTNTNSIIVSNLNNKYIISRPVLDYSNISDNKIEKTLYIIDTVLKNGHEVYIFEDSSHKSSYIDIRQKILDSYLNNSVIIEPIRDNSAYKISLK